MDTTSCPVHTEVDFDPFSSDYQQDPAAALALARSEQPVFFSRTMGYWVVTRHEDIKDVFHDRSTFSACIALDKVTPTSAEAQAVLESYGYAMNRTLVNEDEPVHMARRRLLMEPFLPRHVDTLEPLVRRLAHAAVDGFEAGGRADLVDQMLWTVPLTVALQFLGVPDEDMEREVAISSWLVILSPQQEVGMPARVHHCWSRSQRKQRRRELASADCASARTASGRALVVHPHLFAERKRKPLKLIAPLALEHGGEALDGVVGTHRSRAGPPDPGRWRWRCGPGATGRR
jgi:cytochrome P450